MRNLKKVLSLALAMVMLLGMMVVGAGATEFKDASDIKNTEAVAVVSGIGVLQGDENGSFNPEGTLSRAEAAVVIAKLDLGAAFGNLATTNASTFKDVGAGYGWAKPYIDYCAARGLIAGDGNGHFMPDQKVSGVQFALMVCRVLGYEDANEQIGGDDWAVEAAALARKAGLTVDVVLADPAAISRDDMAQVAFNALQADMVEYKQSAITIGDITIPAGKASPVEDTTNTVDYNSSSDNKVQLCEEKFPKLELDTTDTDNLGRPASIWSYAGDEIASVPNDATLSYTSSVTATALNKDLRNYSVDGSSGVAIVTDGIAASPVTTKAALVSALVSASGKGVAITIFTDDKTISNVSVVNPYFGKVARVAEKDDETTVTVTKLAGGSATVREFKSDAFEKDDYVIYTVGSEDGSTQAIETMVVAESVTGEITATSGTTYLRLDGTRYDYTEGAEAEGESSVADVVPGDATIYLDAEGNVIYVGKVAAAEAQFMYVKGANKYFDTISVRAVFADGTTNVVTLDNSTEVEVTKDAAGTITAVAGIPAHNFTPASSGAGQYAVKLSDLDDAMLANAVSKITDKAYAYTESDDEYKLSDNARIQAAVSNSKIEKDSNKIVDKDTTTTVNATTSTSTVFVMTGSGTTYTGYREVPSMTDVSMVTVNASSTSSVAGLVFITDSETDDSANEYYFFVPVNATKESFRESGSTFYRYTAYVDGEEQQIVVNSTVNSAITSGGAGIYCAAKVNSKDYVTDLNSGNAIALVSMTAQATSKDNGTLILDTPATYTYDDETIYVVVDNEGKDVSAGTIGDIVLKGDGTNYGEPMTNVCVAETKGTTGTDKDAAKVVYIVVGEVADTRINVTDNTGTVTGFTVTAPAKANPNSSFKVTLTPSNTNTKAQLITLNGQKVLYTGDKQAVEVTITTTTSDVTLNAPTLTDVYTVNKTVSVAGATLTVSITDATLSGVTGADDYVTASGSVSISGTIAGATTTGTLTITPSGCTLTGGNTVSHTNGTDTNVSKTTATITGNVSFSASIA